MPKVIYPGPHRAVDVKGVRCQLGEPVAFPPDIAASLIQQGWQTPPIEGSK